MEEKESKRVFVQGGANFNNPIYELAVAITAVGAIDGEEPEDSEEFYKTVLEDSEIEATPENLEQLRAFVKELS